MEVTAGLYSYSLLLIMYDLTCISMGLRVVSYKERHGKRKEMWKRKRCVDEEEEEERAASEDQSARRRERMTSGGR